MTLHGLYELSANVLLLAILPVVMAGWAALTRRCLGLPNDATFSVDNLWLGFVCVVAVLGILHLVTPIAWLSRGLILGMSLVGLATVPNLGQQLAVLRQSILQHPGTATCLLGAALLLCLKSLGVTRNFDSALYHFQTIRWLNEYAIVPGLGNLHGRLAFNQSYFNFLAFLNIEPLATKGYAVAGIFLILLCALSIANVYKLLDIGKAWIGISLASGLAFTFDSLSSPTPDTAIAIVQIYMFVCLIRFFIHHRNTRQVDFDLLAMTIFLAYFIVTVKMSALIFAVGVLLVLLPFIRRLTKDQHKILIRIVCLCFVLLCAHLLRGYILSGVPLFPSTVGAMWGLPWAMLPFNVEGEAIWIYSWARLPGALPSEVLDNWRWFKPWLENLSRFARILLLLDAFLIIANALILIQARNYRKNLGLYSLYVPLLSALTFWFFTAPDFRFLGAIPILLAALSGLLSLIHLCERPKFRSVVDLSNHVEYSRVYHFSLGLLTILIFSYFLHPRSLTLRIAEPLPVAEVRLKTTNFGVKIDVAKDGLCWANPLPCSWFVDDGLKLLDPAAGVRAGFTLR